MPALPLFAYLFAAIEKDNVANFIQTQTHLSVVNAFNFFDLKLHFWQNKLECLIFGAFKDSSTGTLLILTNVGLG
jgi:hypothetical protein